ncbi:hypothetical protein D9756_003278 [Leucocoprinus leucothites]|uniref:Uncharacterized protein n=1 Tax=Leucocoprinus leucothites TaxID=201217 RepID=A0A8H5G6U6_9AGAR|nr:hypothetical protein D9756_003278 [Leucoagaricus leucothites]
MSRISSSPKPTDDVKHSDPIPINPPRGRARSVSSASSGSASSGYDLPTPVSGSLGSNSIRTSMPSPTSPILSYFMSSPTKTSSTFPLRRKFPSTAPVFEEDEEGESEIPVAAHMRRASNQIANRFTEPKTNTLPEPRLERGTGLLRRLSLSSAPFIKPYDPSNSPPSPPPNTAINTAPPMLRSSINLAGQLPSVLIVDALAEPPHPWVKGYSRATSMASSWHASFLSLLHTFHSHLRHSLMSHPTSQQRLHDTYKRFWTTFSRSLPLNWIAMNPS